MISYSDRMTVDVPEGRVGRYAVKRFTIKSAGPRSGADVRAMLAGRAIPPGTYTKLVVGDDPDRELLWMSDTPAEKRDHIEAVRAMDAFEAKRVLINGLGLGMVLAAALSFDHVEQVDVVEVNPQIIELVGPYYEKDHRVRIHQADAYEQAKRWPTGTRWDVGWSDIWMNISTDDLAGHARLNRSYGRRCDWHGCWVHDLLVARRRAEREEERRYEEWHS